MTTLMSLLWLQELKHFNVSWKRIIWPPKLSHQETLLIQKSSFDMMLAMKSSFDKHEATQSKELAEVGSYLANMKHTLSPFLEQLID